MSSKKSTLSKTKRSTKSSTERKTKRSTKRKTTKKLTKAEQIARIPIEEIGKLSGPVGLKQKQDYLRALRYGYNRRVETFKARNLYSYAQDSYEKSKGDLDIPINKMSHNQLLLQIATLQSFFNSETSTVTGINRINRQQDIQIFGKDRYGRPNSTLSKSERELYWNLYDEFMKQNPIRIPQSGEIQRILGSVAFSGDENTIKPIIDYDEEGNPTVLNRMEIINGINTRFQEARTLNISEMSPEEIRRELLKQNVYTGAGPDF